MALETSDRDEPLLHQAVQQREESLDMPYKPVSLVAPARRHFFGTVLVVAASTVFVLYVFFHAAFEATTSLPTTSPATSLPPPPPPPPPPPLSSTTPSRDLRAVLHPQDHVARKPTVAHLSWNISKVALAPDGVEKDVIVINGKWLSQSAPTCCVFIVRQFPGPTIEARSGDTVVVEVTNSMKEAVSLHWHGLHMRGVNDMDGPVGLNQCAIPPGGQFTYQIPTDEQHGTFWYHAHSEVQRADGLYGGFVVHNPEATDSTTYGYDQELLFLVGDWYHWSADRVLAKFLDQTSNGHEPCPDSLLVNGLGYFECAMAVPAAPVNCSRVQKPEMAGLDKSLRYRFRLVNVGSLTGITTTIPDADLNVIQVDGGRPVVSHLASSLGVLYPAQRVDFVVTWPHAAADTDTDFIVDIDDELTRRGYFLQINLALTPTQAFAIRPRSAAAARPARGTTNITALDLRRLEGPPFPSPVPEPEHVFMVYAVVEILAYQNHVPQGHLNHTTWVPQKAPLLTLSRDAWDTHQLVPWTGSKPAWVELTINNIDTQGHPFHLHGFDFYVVGSHEGNGGWDYYNPFTPWREPRGGPFNLHNPVSRDTVYVPAYGYVVIRFLADNEGIWALHCHILWHQASGMSMAVQVLGDADGLSKSAAASNARQHCERWR
ncbi:iron transport multicopper oxidase fet3 [Niveomyces insectorum RCEF 264]|uniref:Iron transport multicopper oxidase fet3 n=1 Tax=Niveomyces insectorum RCEF 264 TaxID=1081102 RepID=A0A167Q8Z3_9HYPO|nr:iron transport multicopper oxidase fet3 [Niveomyces insectorum RCEF 264]